MTDDDRKIAEHRAGHPERMKAAQERVDENLRKHAESSARDAKRTALIARIEKCGGVVHDENCCESERVDLPGVEQPGGGSINIDLSEMDHGDGADPELLVLETIANLLEAYRS